MKVDKRLVFFVSILVFASVFVFAAYSNPPAVWHDSNETTLRFGTNGYFTIQEAIDNNDSRLYIAPNRLRSVEALDGEHDIDHIYVNVSGTESTLREAILTAKGLCPCFRQNCSEIGRFISVYDKDQIEFGHAASEIMINITDADNGYGGEMSLEQAINDGFFCASWDVWKDGCSKDSCSDAAGKVYAEKNPADCRRVADDRVLDDNYCDEFGFMWIEGCHDCTCFEGNGVTLCGLSSKIPGIGVKEKRNCDCTAGCHSNVCEDWKFYGGSCAIYAPGVSTCGVWKDYA